MSNVLELYRSIIRQLQLAVIAVASNRGGTQCAIISFWLMPDVHLTNAKGLTCCLMLTSCCFPLAQLSNPNNRKYRSRKVFLLFSSPLQKMSKLTPITAGIRNSTLPPTPALGMLENLQDKKTQKAIITIYVSFVQFMARK